MDSKIIIVLGGEISVSQLKKVFQNTENAKVIAADKGLEALDAAGIKPDIILGDFDSVDEKVLLKYKNDKLIRFDSVKDFTDGEAAYDIAIREAILGRTGDDDLSCETVHDRVDGDMEHDEVTVTVLGGTGGRTDHALANISLLMKFCDNCISAEMLDIGNRIRVFRGPETISFTKSDEGYKYISLIPLGDKVEGINIEGFKYDAESIVLKQGSSLGVSNELASDKGKVTFEEGYLIVIETV
ncbi:MAG: thiamine diphosphokinase [Eubacterium sp.]|nr:thiamine diphosphokinase [Eubacterium sp.]